MTDENDRAGGLREHRLRRSLLITPGDRPGRLARSVEFDADAVVFDLEDGVGPANKVQARRGVAQALETLEFQGRERIVRINGVDTSEVRADLDSLPLACIDALFLPKVENADAVNRVSAWLDEAEGRGRRVGPAELIVSIETPRGLLNALQIADASRRTTALFFGSGDYAAATASRLSERALAMPRALVVAAAAAAGIQAIDAAYFAAVKDAEATRADALVAKELGFCGKLVFHPNQIAVCNGVFTPSAADVSRALNVLAAWRQAEAEGRGSTMQNGEFVALDIALMAERTLAVARKAGTFDSRGGRHPAAPD